MTTFALHRIKEIEGLFPFFKLEMKEIILFDAFESEIGKNSTISGQLKSLQTTLYRIANNMEVPETKFKVLKGCNDDYTEYEAKTKDLRVYFFKEPETGRIIVMGGRKSNQREDIRQFRNIKRQYILSK
jgi:putative component of toxin-antitoxin plasmid stabilization module